MARVNNSRLLDFVVLGRAEHGGLFLSVYSFMVRDFTCRHRSIELDSDRANIFAMATAKSSRI
jgi:hypothetical protein